MTEIASRFGLLTGIALAATAVLAGCGPTPVTRTVTSETTTAPPPPVAPMLSSSATGIQPAPVQDRYVRHTQHVDRNGAVVSEETTESGSTVMPADPPVQSTTTRSTTETIAPR